MYASLQHEHNSFISDNDDGDNKTILNYFAISVRLFLIADGVKSMVKVSYCMHYVSSET